MTDSRDTNWTSSCGLPYGGHLGTWAGIVAVWMGIVSLKVWVPGDRSFGQKHYEVRPSQRKLVTWASPGRAYLASGTLLSFFLLPGSPDSLSCYYIWLHHSPEEMKPSDHEFKSH